MTPSATLHARAPARPLFAADGYPVFQNRMYATEAEARACPRGAIRLVEDPVTGLVHNAAFDAAAMDYDTAYQNDQGQSPVFARHMQAVADLVIARMGRGPLVEVGCGKGAFVDLLTRRGVAVTGFDPAYEGSDPRIRRAAYEPGTGLAAQGLILRHVLEHIPDPVGFLAQLAAANGGQGTVYVEVPCLDWIGRNRAWFDIFHEHVNYFRLGDFHRMFGRVLHAGHGFGGQYLQVVADLATLRAPRRDPADPPAFPADLAPDLSDARPGDAIWGGASKGVIYALLRERAGLPVSAVIDINPAKQGRHLAATGLRVQAPDAALPALAPGTRILAMNPNYLDEIRARAGAGFDVVPLGA